MCFQKRGSGQGPMSRGEEFLRIPMTGCQHRYCKYLWLGVTKSVCFRELLQNA
jgi:hypothetical protein